MRHGLGITCKLRGPRYASIMAASFYGSNGDVKNVDVATHESKGSVAFAQNGARRGRFSVDRAILPIAGILLGCRYTLVVMQSTLGAAWTVSKQRFVGTALGATMGALLTTYAAENVGTFGAGVFVLGLICAVFGIGRSAFRYAGITLAIRHADSACRTCMDDRHPSVPRNFCGNRCRIAPDCRLAGV